MKKYVLVGTGHRGTNAFVKPITESFADSALLCGLYDRNKLRAKAVSNMAAYEVPVFDSWEEMIETTKPDVVIVTVVDAAHDEYIIKALEAGCDVISEKPLTTDENKLKAIYEAEKKSGKKVTVTFNCRFMPPFMRLKELLKSGIIGNIYSVNYEWLLSLKHGADYFRRWHRDQKNSGSLLIHKSSHHFDILNWVLDDIPDTVNSFGTRRFFGKGNHRSGGKNCRSCSHTIDCEFYTDITSHDLYRNIYVNCEEADGYIRDKCVFSEEIDIADTMNVNIKYKNGAIVTYSLTAHSPFEGVRLSLNGSDGRLEFSNLFGSATYAGTVKNSITIYNRCGEKIDYYMPSNLVTETMRKSGELTKSMDINGGHGGSDPMLRTALFKGLKQDPLGLMADLKAGALSVGIGIAANISQRENRMVSLSEFMDYLLD